ncbi:MAG: DUF1553 domain-containing protein, partial [Planctomycetaceae bacterium]|nr:DUF1553 domain-containing protein [Planctomycetaceae bacterium]
AGWMTGGDSGPAIVPGQPDDSLLLDAISHNGNMSEMPPTSRLSAAVVADFRHWIHAGAVDPRVGGAPPPERKTIDIAAGRKFWAFQPRRPFEPRHSIDDLVLPLAPRASAAQLVRRLYLDLIGLPPTPTQQQIFHRLYAQSPQQAVEQTTDRLLAQPAFGEKWARHWLDIARYADSNGGDFNLTFPEAWRYRNYVIDAFNADMPYDQFLREQLAGDLLPADTAADRNRQLIATGFLMVAPKMLTERNKPKMHLDIADEQLDTVGRAVMGLTIGCARCHDHKFDPIPTTDYYAMAGIFHSTRTADGILMNNVNVSGWTDTPLAVDAATARRAAQRNAEIRQLQQQLQRKEKQLAATAITVDDHQAETKGRWRKSTYRPNHQGAHYLAGSKGQGPFAITWRAQLPQPGQYEVRVSFCGGGGLASNAEYVVRHADGETVLRVDQTQTPSVANVWHPLGRFRFDGEPQPVAEVRLTDRHADNAVIADAIQLVRVDDLPAVGNAQTTALAAEIQQLQQRLKQKQEQQPDAQMAMAARDHTEERLGDLHVRIRGEARNRGPLVPRGFLQVAGATGAAEIPDGESGRRQLADWLTHPDHPLTARVMANRVWQHLLGQGIVATSDNFGRRGRLPTQPELLDHLAGQLIADRWSVKSLIRRIVCSHTYQQVAMTPTDLDPDNARLKHQNRRPVPAETLRDAMLAIAGQLDADRRESVVQQLGMYAIATSGKRHASLGETGKLRQRSIYLPVVRGAEPPSLAVFDLPNPDLVTGQRAATTVPAQALFMMNSPFVREMATAVAESAIRNRDASGAQLDRIVSDLYQRVLMRPPSPAEVADAVAFLQAEQTAESETTVSAATDFAPTNSPPTNPATSATATPSSAADAQTRAVAALVQVLFCSTEFRFLE